MQGSPRIEELRQKFHENPRRYFAPLANEYRKAGDPEQAIAICRAHLAQQPGHMSGHVVYGQALYDARRIDEARTVFEKALSLDPDNAVVLRQLGDIARERGDATEARHWYTRALDADPLDKEVAAYIAELTEPLTEAATAPEPATTPTEPAERTEEPAEPVAAEAYVAAEPAFDPERIVATGEFPSLDVETEQPKSEEPPEEAPIAAGMADEPAPEPIIEPLAVSDAAVERPAAIEPEVLWRKTPPHEESPFVTRTMAELYARQGYRAAALDVYRQLALNHPDDEEIRGRIADLSRGERGQMTEEEASVEEIRVEETRIEDIRVEETIEPTTNKTEARGADEDVTQAPGDIVFAPSSEDLNLEPEADDAVTGGTHFTELELATGDTWDTDAWGAGFSPDEGLDLEFSAPDTVSDSAPESLSASTSGGAPESEAEIESEIESEFEAEIESEGVADRIAEQPAATEAPVEEVASAETRLDEPGAAYSDQPQIVAYSPQAPEQDDIPHFAARGPTIREFFATLGAKRPPTDEEGAEREAEPEAEPEAEYPLAADALANLFADSPVSEEDSRAAFALSGAMSGEVPESFASPVPDFLAHESSAAETPGTEETAGAAQESEDDIRRFREWLDGLAES